MEYNLLSLFLRNSGKVLTTRYLISAIWGSGYGEDTQALRALMAGLRRKIEENPAKPRYIVTEIGVGWWNRKFRKDPTNAENTDTGNTLSTQKR